MNLRPDQAREMLAEIFDDQKVNRVNFFCAKHGYKGPVKDRPEITPGLSCAECWKIFYLVEIVKTPPDERAQKLEELEEIMQEMNKLIETGKFDLIVNPHAEVSIGVE